MTYHSTNMNKNEGHNLNAAQLELPEEMTLDTHCGYCWRRLTLDAEQCPIPKAHCQCSKILRLYGRIKVWSRDLVYLFLGWGTLIYIFHFSALVTSMYQKMSWPRYVAFAWLIPIHFYGMYILLWRFRRLTTAGIIYCGLWVHGVLRWR